ncbi:MAG TPA: carboxypeptidase-like regulatory domain-containing protein, partial [Herpetosiphonaceae bacterium]|nr:carboxypeptidase-like regulatory domain-containing protein [Herpetosiphonaceae bacterium]
QSDANGAYSAFAVLESGVLTPTLAYLVEVNNDTPLRLESTVVAQPGGLTQHGQDFHFASRKITLSGTVNNLTDPALKLQGKILIVAPTLDQQLCEASVADGAYRCTALIRTDEPFELNYRAEGVWGATTLVNQIVPGGATAFAKNLDAAPRVLHFTGTVKNPDDAPLANAKVSISSYSIVQGAHVRRDSVTDAAGRYRSAVILGDGQIGGDLSYLVERNGNTASLQSSFAFSGTTRLLTVTQDLALNSRVINFEGSLINTLVNSQGAWSQSRVTISSPTLGKLCEVYTTRSYGCSATVNTNQPFDVEYRVFGDWGSASATARMETLPPVGGQGSLRKDIGVTPTMLRISGLVTDGSGGPRAGVLVNPAIPSPFVSTIWHSAPSDTQGRYEVVVILRQVSGSASGTIRLEAGYRSTRQYREAPFSASEGALASVSGPGFEFTERQVVLNGQLINTLASAVPAAQPKAYITLTAPNGELFCRVYGSSYNCPIAVYSSDPLEAIISVAGDWGGAEQRVLVETIPAPGGSATVTTNIEVAPTTLHLTGVIADPGGQPLINADLHIKLSSERDALTGKTDGIGQYSIYKLLKGGTDNGSLDYKITYDGIVTEFGLNNIAVAAGELNFRREDFTFEKRRVRFAGKVTNQLVAGLPVPARVTITSPDLFTTRYCDAATDAVGNYSCDAFVRSSEPFSVTYRVTGGWGVLDVAGAASGIPNVGGSVIIEKNIQVAPTTLRLTGTLTDGYGKNLANADVRIAGTGTIQSVTAKTNANGGYSAYVMLNDNLTSGDLTYQIQYYRATLSQSRPFFGLVENQVNEFPQDFEIASRELTFIGRVRHGAAPSLGLNGKVTISSPAIGTICTAATTGDGDYYCPVAAITTEAFSATYTVEGDWGKHAATFPVSFGVVGSAATVSQV